MLVTLSPKKPTTKTAMNITAPTVHLNGTPATDLWAGYEAAYDAVRAAQDALAKIEFNARDYYVQGPEAWNKALNHRIEQAASLRQVEDYLFQHLIELQQQKK
jgi:hypothetical protein